MKRISNLNPNVEFEILVEPGTFKFLDESYGPRILVRQIPETLRPSRIVSRVRQTIRSISMISRGSLNTTYKYKLKDRMRRGPFSLLFSLGILALNRFLPLEKLALGLEAIVFSSNSNAREFIRRSNPDLLLFASVIHDQLNIVDILRAARSAKVPLLGYVASWDNLTSKGPFFEVPDKVLVWGRVHKSHAKEEHGISVEKVVPVGVPHFDAYFENDSSFSREQFLSERGLDPQKRTIFFVGTTKHKSANEPEILKALSKEVREANGCLRGTQIWYRPHPRMLYSSKSEIRDIPGIYFDDQSARQLDSMQKGYSVRSNDILHTSRTLKSIDVVLSAFSTMIIEAALLGKPSVILRFAQGKGMIDDIEGTAKYRHLEEIGSWDFLKTAYSLTDCATMINELLSSDPAVLKETLIRQATEVVNNPIASAHEEFSKILIDELRLERKT